MTKKKRKPAAQSLDWKLLYQELDGESERAVAIVGAAMLDESLKRLLMNFFIDDREVDTLFERRGLFESLGAKVSIAYCLGLMTDEQRNDIALIQQIRNKFAHKLQVTSFREKSITESCNKLKLPKRIGFINQPNPSRGKFQAAVATLLYTFSIRASQVTLERRMAPNDSRRIELEGDLDIKLLSR